MLSLFKKMYQILTTLVYLTICLLCFYAYAIFTYGYDCPLKLACVPEKKLGPFANKVNQQAAVHQCPPAFHIAAKDLLQITDFHLQLLILSGKGL